ncbi:DNA-directed RNA polymerase III subunit RPC7-like [Hylaeus anthracinus]|uniref:DNA-directed RNA polymerase III subunit RPC7-like n=1 Tax=Hylaeus volcanicus TaxID=313075 RepID=UPI0023B7A667|nr:DNA-directed RNA polymerase III subunit RPC7-like [Hylaeus volcanicus]XP_053985069.1 DNA-directed RNA polymerase III subunit RPC7-like [Hylaeus volcanicus]XP_053985076.1 DNA-directed RNA polymerase III subunit RPC7-like [Hylaeus volcanicus]XP_054005360.1 DNA-directed RNA polymerase III subunit RPC7-like [Hylaeus anthracinus]XP_054005361.1 DNA-directed RNA polymerase III subunit RPC7-like [Hylaeus anthracinus]
MASRGRGRGKPSMSISTEQLGFSKGEALPPPVLQPPPKYPVLEYKPLPLTITNEMSYLLELKREFAEFMRESPNNVVPHVIKKDIDRYSDRYQDLITDKSGYETRYDWSRMPAELKPLQRKRKGSRIKKPEEKKKNVDVESKLKELENKESTQQSDAEEDGKEEEETEEKEEDHVEDEEEEPDEEMDEGTDYVNNYFDNGEGYDDEDDNLDDGPIY